MMDRLIARHVADGVLVFDNDSGATHFLPPAAWELLTRQLNNASSSPITPEDANLLSQLRLAGLLA